MQKYGIPRKEVLQPYNAYENKLINHILNKGRDIPIDKDIKLVTSP